MEWGMTSWNREWRHEKRDNNMKRGITTWNEGWCHDVRGAVMKRRVTTWNEGWCRHDMRDGVMKRGILSWHEGWRHKKRGEDMKWGMMSWHEGRRHEKGRWTSWRVGCRQSSKGGELTCEFAEQNNAKRHRPTTNTQLTANSAISQPPSIIGTVAPLMQPSLLFLSAHYKRNVVLSCFLPKAKMTSSGIN